MVDCLINVHQQWEGRKFLFNREINSETKDEQTQVSKNSQIAPMNKRADMQSLHILNHSKCMLAAFHNLRQDESMLDVTLACQGLSVKAHKLILSACSPFFKSLFESNPCKHPIVILKDVEYIDLKAVIDFLYKGELSVPRERLISTLKVAEDLQIRGLTRSESNRIDYEKLYQKVHERQSGRKRRKKYHKRSSESEGRDDSDNTDSDNIVSQSDDSADAKTAEKTEPTLSPTYVKDQGSHGESSDEIDETRPVVLRVTEPADNKDLNISKDVMEVENISGQPESTFPNVESDENDSNQKDVNVDEEISVTSLSVPEDASVCTSKASNSSCRGATEGSNSVIPVVEIDRDNDQDMETTDNVSLDTAGEDTNGIKQVPMESNSSPPTVKSQPTTQSEQADSESETGYANENLVGFECSTCGLILTSHPALIRHEIVIHKSSSLNRSLKCNHCSFTTRKVSRLKCHMLMHCKK